MVLRVKLDTITRYCSNNSDYRAEFDDALAAGEARRQHRLAVEAKGIEEEPEPAGVVSGLLAESRVDRSVWRRRGGDPPRPRTRTLPDRAPDPQRDELLKREFLAYAEAGIPFGEVVRCLEITGRTVRCWREADALFNSRLRAVEEGQACERHGTAPSR